MSPLARDWESIELRRNNLWLTQAWAGKTHTLLHPGFSLVQKDLVSYCERAPTPDWLIILKRDSDIREPW